MTKLWKISMLVLLLAIPAMAYIFLQMFGENRYDVPVFYEHGVDAGVGDCKFANAQHYVSTQSFSALTAALETASFSSVTVFSFLSSNCEDTCQTKFNQLSRIANYFSPGKDVKIVSIIYSYPSATPQMQLLKTSGNNWIFVNDEGAELETFLSCALVLPYNNRSLHQFVIVDEKMRIRGYYDALDITDVDRLMTEVRILLSNYNKQDHEQNNS